MAVDWDAELLCPVMAVFGEGQETDPTSWPTYRASSTGAAFQLPGAVFDREYKRVSDEDGITQTSSHPVLGVRNAVFVNAGLAQPAQGATVFIHTEAKLYAVADVQPDGHGHILLILIEAVA